MMQAFVRVAAQCTCTCGLTSMKDHTDSTQQHVKTSFQLSLLKGLRESITIPILRQCMCELAVQVDGCICTLTVRLAAHSLLPPSPLPRRQQWLGLGWKSRRAPTPHQQPPVWPALHWSGLPSAAPSPHQKLIQMTITKTSTYTDHMSIQMTITKTSTLHRSHERSKSLTDEQGKNIRCTKWRSLTGCWQH